MTQETLNRLKGKFKDWVGFRAEQLSFTTEELHLNAPRGGKNLNAFGQPRSAPYEVPAVEHGGLLERLYEPPNETRDGFEVNVNYVVLEYGYSVGARTRLSDKKSLNANGLAPRPLGRIAVEKFKADVQ